MGGGEPDFDVPVIGRRCQDLTIGLRLDGSCSGAALGRSNNNIQRRIPQDLEKDMHHPS